MYGAVWDVDNQKVQHIRISMTEYLPAIQGSKYVHSSISREVFQSIIRDVKTNKVLFIGTPCQVSAVRNIVGENDNLFCIDLVCHGVPSGEMLEKQLKKITDENIIELSFRRGTQFILELKDEKGTIYSRDGYDNPYYALFLMFASLRESCYHCRYAQRSRVGDLTIGDYMEGGKGYSCVLANAEKGVLLKSLTESVIEYKERSVNALMDNVALNHPTARDTRVDAFTKRYNEHGLFHAYYRTFYKLALKRSLRHLFGDKIYYGIVKRFKSEP